MQKAIAFRLHHRKASQASKLKKKLQLGQPIKSQVEHVLRNLAKSCSNLGRLLIFQVTKLFRQSSVCAFQM